MTVLPPTPPLTAEGFGASTWQRWFDILRNNLNKSYSGLNMPPDYMPQPASAAAVEALSQGLRDLELRIAVLPDSAAVVAQLRLVMAVLGEDATFKDLTATGKFGANGKPAQAAVTLPAAATDLATTMALANALRGLVIANGLGA